MDTSGWMGPCHPPMLVGLAVLTILLLPTQLYVPGSAPPEAPPPPAEPVPPAPPRLLTLPLQNVGIPTLDAMFTALLVSMGVFVYACEWVQRKLMERRIVKLNAYLGASVERLRAWDAQQEQLESTLRMVSNATAEYNLLLWLLLRQRRCVRDAGPPSNCFFGKHDDADLSFLRPCVV